MTERPDAPALSNAPAAHSDDLLGAVRASPAERGTVRLLLRRPGPGRREVLDVAHLDEASGVVGDDWIRRRSRSTPDRRPSPDRQVTVVNVAALAVIEADPDRWPLAGDQVGVDLDLSVANLPAGTRLLVGTAELEVTAAPHTGCAKFASRFGREAVRLVNSAAGRALRLRGLNTRVVRGGTVRVGDAIAKLAPPPPSR